MVKAKMAKNTIVFVFFQGKEPFFFCDIGRFVVRAFLSIKHIYIHLFYSILI